MTAARTPAQQGRASRAKGARGEREVCALLSRLTGRAILRRVRNHEGDSDLTGLEPWCIEVKTYARSSPALIAGWWAQACQQAARAGGVPLLIYKIDRQPWRCVWPACVLCEDEREIGLIVDDYQSTVTASPEVWWQLCCEISVDDIALV